MLALIAALALGSAVALGKELSDRTLRSESEAGMALALPVLAVVPELNGVRGMAMLPMQTQAEA
jgi:capsular polysaccharide biosynthesis protein